MAKIKINKLPEGYVVRDGKVVKAFYHGGSNLHAWYGWNANTCSNFYN